MPPDLSIWHFPQHRLTLGALHTSSHSAKVAIAFLAPYDNYNEYIGEEIVTFRLTDETNRPRSRTAIISTDRLRSLVFQLGADQSPIEARRLVYDVTYLGIAAATPRRRKERQLIKKAEERFAIGAGPVLLSKSASLP